MTEFEAVLDRCLEALREGRSIDACLAEHPQHADALRPLLAAAEAAMRAYAVQPPAQFAAEARARFLIATGEQLQQVFDVRPSAEFAEAARERFLVATGERLAEAFDDEPTPSFFASARAKFLIAARRLTQVSEPARRPVPVFGTAFRAVATAGAALVMFLGFSTYTVASANDALPGDWRYPVKLQTERVRLALAFSEDAERDVKLDIAAERVRELERLSAKGRIIGPGVLDRLASQTAPLVEAAKNGELDDEETARLNEVTGRSKQVLEQAEPQVAPEAQEKLAEARAITDDGFVITSIAAAARASGPIVITPVVPLDSAAGAGDETETPEPTATPGATETAERETPETVATPTPVRTSLSVDLTPVADAHGVQWIRVSSGRLSTYMPSPDDGWSIANANITDGPTAAPKLLQIRNIDGTSLIIINPANGDTYWFYAINGQFDEVQLRMERDGEVFVTDADLLRRLYGPAAEIPLYVADHIDIAPRTTPTPESDGTPTATSDSGD